MRLGALVTGAERQAEHRARRSDAARRTRALLLDLIEHSPRLVDVLEADGHPEDARQVRERAELARQVLT